MQITVFTKNLCNTLSKSKYAEKSIRFRYISQYSFVKQQKIQNKYIFFFKTTTTKTHLQLLLNVSILNVRRNNFCLDNCEVPVEVLIVKKLKLVKSCLQYNTKYNKKRQDHNLASSHLHRVGSQKVYNVTIEIRRYETINFTVLHKTLRTTFWLCQWKSYNYGISFWLGSQVLHEHKPVISSGYILSNGNC